MFIALVFVLAACGEAEVGVEPEPESEPETENNDYVVIDPEAQLEVMVTMFAQYDFARQIGGEHLNVSRLVAPGVDIHSFDPTPTDIIAINEADLFIYTGDEMEPWVHRILDSLDTNDLAILDVSTGANFLPWYGSRGHDHDDHDHDHDDHDHDHDDHDHDHDDHDHDHDDHDHDDHDHDDHDHDDHDHDDHDPDHDEEDEEDHHDHNHDHDEEDDHHDHDEEDDHHNHDHDDDHDHSHNYDPHIWTSPVNAIIMVNNIQDYLTTLMPENADDFAYNAETLIAELEELDQEFRDLMGNAERTTIYHAGRFAMHYLVQEYGIDFVAAAMETEPDPTLVAQMIYEIESYNIPVIFHEELVDPQIANMIAEETGAQALVLHTIHNVSADDISAGITYIDLQRQNIEALRIALN